MDSSQANAHKDVVMNHSGSSIVTGCDLSQLNCEKSPKKEQTSGEMSKGDQALAKTLLEELESENPNFRLRASERLLTLEQSPQEQLKMVRFIKELNEEMWTSDQDLPEVKFSVDLDDTQKAIVDVREKYTAADKEFSEDVLEQESNRITLAKMTTSEMKRDLKEHSAEVAAMDKEVASYPSQPIVMPPKF